MRLTCPNCGAQYEVPDEVIPESGRDVQCSNCAITWFQAHPDFPVEEPEPAQQEPVWEEPAPAPEPSPEPEPEREPELAPEPQPKGDDSLPPPRRELDPGVKDVLREEAEREARARAAEIGGIETQTDLGLDDPEDPELVRARQAQARMARLRGLPDTDPADEGPEPDIDPGPRSNLLPDIEEINSSLEHSNGPRQSAEADVATAAVGATPGKSSGFRMGFWVVILIVLLLMALYIMAPKIAELAPPLRAPLESYVEMVNAGRLWLDAKVAGWMGNLDSMSSTANPPEG